jgi:hypothetical protein
MDPAPGDALMFPLLITASIHAIATRHREGGAYRRTPGSFGSSPTGTVGFGIGPPGAGAGGVESGGGRRRRRGRQGRRTRRVVRPSTVRAGPQNVTLNVDSTLRRDAQPPPGKNPTRPPRSARARASGSTAPWRAERRRSIRRQSYVGVVWASRPAAVATSAARCARSPRRRPAPGPLLHRRLRAFGLRPPAPPADARWSAKAGARGGGRSVHRCPH